MTRKNTRGGEGRRKVGGGVEETQQVCSTLAFPQAPLTQPLIPSQFPQLLHTAIYTV
jgi:hypothetical protein